MTTTAHHPTRVDDPAAPVTVHLVECSLTADLARLRSEVARGVMQGRGEITVDVSRLDHISSPTVAAILWARRSCAARQIAFRVTGDAGRNARVLRTCGLSLPGGGSSW